MIEIPKKTHKKPFDARQDIDMKQTENREYIFVSHYQAIRIPNILQENEKILSVRKQQSKIKEELCLKFHSIRLDHFWQIY
jgi:hypothetical protein